MPSKKVWGSEMCVVLVKDAYPPRRKCAREQMLITSALSAIKDTQVINRSGTAEFTAFE